MTGTARARSPRPAAVSQHADLYTCPVCGHTLRADRLPGDGRCAGARCRGAPYLDAETLRRRLLSGGAP